jgi:Fic family protein
MEEYLTVAEIAQLLKINQQTVRNTVFRPGVGVFPDAVGLQRW